MDPACIYTPATLTNMAEVLGGQRADDILAHLAGSPYEALAEPYTTAIWTEPALASYRRFTDLGRTAYAYRFTRVSPGNRRTGMLAHHSAELPYLFGHLTPAEQYDERTGRERVRFRQPRLQLPLLRELPHYLTRQGHLMDRGCPASQHPPSNVRPDRHLQNALSCRCVCGEHRV